MSRAARRRAEREAVKRGGTVEKHRPQMIKLANPIGEADLYDVFIVGNSEFCERVAEQGALTGKTLVICGAGPSLADEAERWCRDGFDELWGCNSALPWLAERGYPVTHGITVDQTPAMIVEWLQAPDVEYLLASTVHPHLTRHLLAQGRRLTWFHNFVGIKKPPVSWCECGHDHPDTDGEPLPVCDECECVEYQPRVMAYEDWLYSSCYPPTIRAGSGLNTVTRAVDLALAMGAAKVVVLGADCALRVKRPLPRDTAHGSPEHVKWLEEETLMHADGGHALASGATPVTLGGEIDGRWWESKPDMMISAVFMLKMQDAAGADRLVYVGDTLPNALRNATSFRTNSGELVTVNVLDEFIDRLPVLLDSNGKPIPITGLGAAMIEAEKVAEPIASL